jgi:hypothetical protein
MKAVQICLALSLAFVSALAGAQALWRDVPAGSSPTEVRQRIAEALPSAPDTLAQSPQALLEIPAVDVAGGDFKVRFMFEDERLHSVVLRAETGSPEAAQALARRVYTALRARYGLEQSSTSRGAPPPSRRIPHLDERSPGLTISMPWAGAQNGLEAGSDTQTSGPPHR